MGQAPAAPPAAMCSSMSVGFGAWQGNRPNAARVQNPVMQPGFVAKSHVQQAAVRGNIQQLQLLQWHWLSHS